MAIDLPLTRCKVFKRHEFIIWAQNVCSCTGTYPQITQRVVFKREDIVVVHLRTSLGSERPDLTGCSIINPQAFAVCSDAYLSCTVSFLDGECAADAEEISEGRNLIMPYHLM